MKNIVLVLFALIIFKQQTLALSVKYEANQTLKATVSRLNVIQTLNYHYAREINNFKDNSFSKSAADCYLEFDKSAHLSKFQFNNNDMLQIYNGTEFFTLDKKDKTFEVKENPGQRSFNNLSFFYNSIASLKSVLPAIIADDSIAKAEHDTLIANKQYKVVTLAMHNKAIDYLGSYRRFTIKITLYYDLIIDVSTYLPYQVIERNNVDGDKYYTRTTYTAINTKPVQPGEFSWFYSTYQKEYQPKKMDVNVPLISDGAALPDWSLPDFSTPIGPKLQKDNFKGKLVLMDFWIKNCGPCMESFPHLQALQKKYGSSGFQLLAINSYDHKEDIGFFYKREKPLYKMLYDGQPLAKQLGVESTGYPTVILTDKQGTVIYSGGFDADKLDKLIKENIE